MVDDTRGWPSRRPLSEAFELDGALSITVVDRLARATVWSMTFAPDHPQGRPDPVAGTETRQVRIADDVLDTVRAVEQLVPASGTDGSWFEVILIDANHYHLLRPFGSAADELLLELVLDARSANLAAARQRLDELAPAPDPTDRDLGSVESVPLSVHPVAATGLPRRTAAVPADGVRAEPGPPVGDQVLTRLAEALRTRK